MCLHETWYHIYLLELILKIKQAGAKLCQAQDQLGLPAEAKLILEVVYTLGCAGEDL